MTVHVNRVAFPVPRKAKTAAGIIARQDRIPVWGLSYLVIAIVGMGVFFVYFDIGDINVSFIQTCVEIVPRCLPETATSYLGLPVLLNLLGYVFGALFLSPFSDRFGRRDAMVITMIITGLGSLYTVFVGDYMNFVLARTITGIGIGADLALVNTYINEIAPTRGRAHYTALIFIMATAGSSLGVALGLYLTTPAAPFPLGLPFALASPHFMIGWRVVYAIGASLSVLGLLLRFGLPESPRWLVAHGRLAEAERVVSDMERHALRRVRELPPVDAELPVRVLARSTGYREIFGNALYLKRTILLLSVWLLGYITVYANIAGSTVLLAALKYPLSEAGLISSLGIIGTFIGTLVVFLLGERLERKHWIAIAAVFSLTGEIMLPLNGGNFTLAALGSIIISLGAFVWLPMAYSWSTENYPTRARASGFALVDGIGHIGGGIGVSYVASLILRLGPLRTFMLIGCFLLVASWLAQFGPATRNRRLDEVSP